MNSITMKNNDNGQTVVTENQLEEFQSNFRGDVFHAGTHGYDTVRKIWNGMFDRKPGLVARCVGTSDVIRAVNFGRENDLEMSVKGGGHNSAGTAVTDGGLMIDLSLMRRVTVDRENKTARVDGGCLLGDVDYETQLHGLAVSGGIVSHTGVGGLALGGGFGWISRKHGLSVDNLISAEVVTAKGEFVTASATENADLFWGIRGGGGNFGIVTAFEFKCAEIGTEVYSGLIVKDFSNAQEYMRFHREYVRGLPDEMTVWMVARHAPPLPFLPETVHGKMVVIVPFVLNLHTRWQDKQDDEKCMQWARDFHAGTQDFAQGVYVNFLSQEGEDRIKEAYTDTVWKRLVEVKKKWDPENRFHLNQNIRPE